MIMTRVLDHTGKLKWHGLIPDRLPHIRVEMVPDPEDMIFSIHVEADLERELTVEDGGPLLIYRMTKETNA